jgi:hypothetical protein
VEIDGTTFGMQVDASAGPAVTFTGTTFGIQVTANNGPALSAVVTGGNAAGVVATGYGSGEGIIVTGGATGEGLEIIGGATSGSAMKVWANGTNDVGLEIIGLGSGAGVKIDAGATGVGLKINSTEGAAIELTVATAGNGICINAGGAAAGVSIEGDEGYGLEIVKGVNISGGGLGITNPYGVGLAITGSTSGMTIDGSAGAGVHAHGTTFGIDATASAGPAISAVASTGNNVGIQVSGVGTGAGVKIDAGATGIGLDVNATSGSAADFTTGTGAGFLISGSTFGMNIAASAGDGIQAVGAGGGYDIDADIHGTIDAATTLTTYTGNTPQTADSKTILDMLKPLSTTVLAAVSTSSFTLTDGSASASAYVGMLVKVTDAHAATLPETRRIITYAVTTKTVTVDRAFSFTPTAGDTVVIGGYGNVSAVDSNEVALANVKTRLPQ